MEYTYRPPTCEQFEEDGKHILRRECVIDVGATNRSRAWLKCEVFDTRFETIDGDITEITILRHPAYYFAWERVDERTPMLDLLLIGIGQALANGSVTGDDAQQFLHDLWWSALKADPELRKWTKRWFPQYWDAACSTL